MSGDSTKDHGTTMAEPAIFFKLYLYPDYELDRAIIAWIKTIPKQQRSRKLKQVIDKGIDGDLAPQELIRSRSLSFQLALNKERDRRIILMLNGIPQRMRSMKLKEMIFKGIQPVTSPSSVRPHLARPEAGQMAKRVFGSIKKPQSE